MNKGFLFSLDAIAAIIIIITLIGVWSISMQVNENKNVISSLDRQSHDAAIIAFYTANDVSELLTPPPDDKEFGACNKYYEYSVPDDSLLRRYFCKEMGD